MNLQRNFVETYHSAGIKNRRFNKVLIKFECLKSSS